MLVKIHRTYREIVAICDSELLGKIFKEGKIKLELTKFYEGEEKTEEETLEIIQDMAIEDATFNIVGEKSVALAISCGIISKEGIKTVQGVPFALVLL